jgi:hypothetical protein
MSKVNKIHKLTPILINHADNVIACGAFEETDVSGRGFRVAYDSCRYANAGCNKLYYSDLVPGIVVVHAPRGYLSVLKMMYGRSLRPRVATPALIEEAIWDNAERYDIAIYAGEIEDEIRNMLAPVSGHEGIMIYCSDEVYAEVIAQKERWLATGKSPSAFEAA